jgi:regulator of replication initiation timing
MQRLGNLTLLLILICAAQAEGFDNLSQTANQIFHLSEEMVFHGSEGHVHELVDYGEKMIIEIDKLTRDLKNLKHANQKALQKSIKATRDKTASAIRLGKQGNLVASLASAKSALFHAKKVRQELR